ncbi:MAG: ROK family protein [Chloroflexi bacterium]|nr:ROK family protein [Chloroflexota bacterium]
MPNQIIAVDLGGTQIRTARYDLDLNLLQRENTLTLAHLGVQPTIERMKTFVRKVRPARRDEILGIGISSPGPLNPFTGVIVAPPNLHGWLDVPLRDIMETEFHVPVFIGNDANVAALAEAFKGAAQGCRHVVYITVSTGIGAGIICDGKLLLGREGLAAEFGHIPIVLENGTVSSVELEAAGPEIARRAKRAIQEGAKSKVLDIVNGDLNRIDAKAVGIAAAAGDQLAIAQLAYAGRIIGLGIVSILHLFNPEVVVIGGGVSKTGDLLFAPMRETARAHVMDEAYIEHLRIEQSALGDDVALVGAAALVATDGGNLDISELDQRF